jgi:hypothetical protein
MKKKRQLRVKRKMKYDDVVPGDAFFYFSVSVLKNNRRFKIDSADPTIVIFEEKDKDVEDDPNTHMGIVASVTEEGIHLFTNNKGVFVEPSSAKRFIEEIPDVEGAGLIIVDSGSLV